MKTKIVYCIPSLYSPGGMERVVSLKANYLADNLNYDITIIITDGKDKKPFYDLSSSIKVINLDINYNELYGKSLPKKAFGYFQKQYLYKKKLKKTLCKIRPDITISTLRREINFINSIDDGSIKVGEIHFNKANYRDFKNEKVFSFIQKIVTHFWMGKLIKELKQLGKFVVLSHEDKQKWTELDNITVIHNPLSFFPEKKSSCTSQQVIAVGRYMPEKGFDLLINAWNIVNKKHPEWKLRIFGDGMRKELESQVKSLSLSNSCILEYPTTNISDKYIESSIFVLSSRHEGFGMVITEAMACGVPPIAFTCPCGPREIIKDGTDGLLVENGNIMDLANKICYLIENDEIRKNMGKSARINVERFKIENIAMQWKELFDTLLKTKNEANINY
ncbi:glycosyltransferase family 4 protein [Bacteroides sedimenti]|uniref:Glycosyl transferase n=1 Tax=Bacteroides sedimenti TaxID=2136147 RepID=A0ABN6Z2H8_9BACE